LFQSGDHPQIATSFGHSDEGLAYIYPADFDSLAKKSTSERKKPKIAVKAARKHTKGQRRAS
jgi:hypothetical protein